MDRHSRPGPEPTTLEAVGNQWRYALVVVQAGEEEEVTSVTEILFVVVVILYTHITMLSAGKQEKAQVRLYSVP